MKYQTSKIHTKVCPNCKHWFGIVTKKRFNQEENVWVFKIVCKSCDLSSKEFVLVDEARLDWNTLSQKTND
ncbi:hypothetical protein DLM77_21015 [Leptospira yasudae]|uniref:Uncharacterized protein n=1 Tax=Leptospira yasudae TaxID=2202201 RepID=A0ABX9LXG6_9LEPT|nr:hypothetical protein DLM77_21015 [Leptospira yasudae]